MRAILTSGYGIRADVGWIIELVIDRGLYDDYTDKDTCRDIRRLGEKLGGTANRWLRRRIGTSAETLVGHMFLRDAKLMD
jgi:hypothetical protein